MGTKHSPKCLVPNASGEAGYYVWRYFILRMKHVRLIFIPDRFAVTIATSKAIQNVVPIHVLRGLTNADYFPW